MLIGMKNLTAQELPKVAKAPPEEVGINRIVSDSYFS